MASAVSKPEPPSKTKRRRRTTRWDVGGLGAQLPSAAHFTVTHFYPATASPDATYFDAVELEKELSAAQIAVLQPVQVHEGAIELMVHADPGNNIVN
eukprot:SAG11_NODE_8381_length_1020_cov_1.604550_1_plen_96_part_01